MLFNERVETMSRDEMKASQLARLKMVMKRAYDRVPFYRERMDAIGMKPEDIRTLKDIEKMPFTVKTDLRDHYPYGLFAEPMENIVRLHASSGTTGKPIVAGYTRDDLNNWSECIARLATAAGATKGDIAQISFGYGLFTGAFGLHQGLEKIGATVIPISSGNTERQINIMRDFGATVLIATPSYALYMAEVAEKMGALKDIHIKYGLFGAEASTEEMRRELERRWGCVATENYGLTEVMGPGVAGECLYKCGMHINEDHFLCEIIDPVTGEVLPDGEQGEMVITTLTKQGMPMIRYRTRDITRIIPGECACGRTHRRIDRLHGRTDDMLIIRGVNVFPSQIEDVMKTFDQLSSWYVIELTRENHLDVVTLKVEPNADFDFDSTGAIDKLQKAIQERMKTALSVGIRVRIVEPQTIARSEGKAKRVIDLRGEDK